MYIMYKCTYLKFIFSFFYKKKKRERKIYIREIEFYLMTQKILLCICFFNFLKIDIDQS